MFAEYIQNIMENGGAPSLEEIVTYAETMKNKLTA